MIKTAPIHLSLRVSRDGLSFSRGPGTSDRSNMNIFKEDYLGSIIPSSEGAKRGVFFSLFSSRHTATLNLDLKRQSSQKSAPQLLRHRDTRKLTKLAGVFGLSHDAHQISGNARGHTTDH